MYSRSVRVSLSWAQLSTEQQERVTRLGIRCAALPLTAVAPARLPAVPTDVARGPRAGSKVQAAFQRGLAALAQWVEREGVDRPVPRGHGEQILVDGEAEPVTVKLGVWVSNTKSRRDKLTEDQLAALAKVGVDWAGAARVARSAPAQPAALQAAPSQRDHPR